MSKTRPVGRPPKIGRPIVTFQDRQIKRELARIAKRHGDTMTNVAVSVLRSIDIETTYLKGVS